MKGQARARPQVQLQCRPTQREARAQDMKGQARARKALSGAAAILRLFLTAWSLQRAEAEASEREEASCGDGHINWLHFRAILSLGIVHALPTERVACYKNMNKYLNIHRFLFLW